jgi:hypothetical protein
MYAGQIDTAEVLKKWLDAQEPDPRCRTTEVINAWDAIPLVLNAYPPPNVRSVRGITKFGSEQVPKTLGTFGKNLVSVPVGLKHDARHTLDVLVGYAVLEEIAHTIDENSLWRGPSQGFQKLLRHQARREPMLIRVAGDAAETLGECLRIAVFAAGADFKATTHWIPGRLRPLDLGMLTHSASAPTEHFVMFLFEKHIC